MRYLLIDRITEVVPWQSATGLKGVALGEDFFADHFPERPVMPGVLMIEALAQLSGWLIAASTSFRQSARVVSIGQAKFRKFVSPGTQLQLRVTLAQSTTERIRVDGCVSAEGLTVTQAEIFVEREILLARAQWSRQRQCFQALFQQRGENP